MYIEKRVRFNNVWRDHITVTVNDTVQSSGKEPAAIAYTLTAYIDSSEISKQLDAGLLTEDNTEERLASLFTKRVDHTYRMLPGSPIKRANIFTGEPDFARVNAEFARLREAALDVFYDLVEEHKDEWLRIVSRKYAQPRSVCEDFSCDEEESVE